MVGGWRRADQRVAPAARSGGGGQGDVVWRVAAPVGVNEAASALAGVDQHVAARSSARQPPVDVKGGTSSV